jgi:hypothetical protein
MISPHNELVIYYRAANGAGKSARPEAFMKYIFPDLESATLSERIFRHREEAILRVFTSGIL